MYNLNTPIWQLTVGEFIELQQKTAIDKPKPEPALIRKKNFVYGIAGLAELLNCSKTTAQKIKNSGLIDKAITQVGKKIVFDPDMVINLLNGKKK